LRELRDYRKYEVWQKAHTLTLFVYKNIMPDFPKSEQFELSSQLKRAVYSVPLKIVEGCGRSTDRDFVHFLDIALGSIHEVAYCTLLAFDLGYIEKEKYEQVTEMIHEITAKLINLIKSIRE